MEALPGDPSGLLGPLVASGWLPPGFALTSCGSVGSAGVFYLASAELCPYILRACLVSLTRVPPRPFETLIWKIVKFLNGAAIN